MADPFNSTDYSYNDNENIIELKNCYHLTYVYVLSGWHQVVYYTLIVAYISLAIPTILLNALAILVFKGRNFKKQPSNILIMSSTIADLATGAVSLPLGFAHLVTLVWKQQVVCLLYAAALFPAYSFCVLSFITVFYISVDRYLAVLYPFFYAKVKWKRVYRILIAASWLLTFGLVASSYLFVLFKPVFFFLSVQPFLISLNCAMMVRVWKVIRKARKADLNQLVVRKISGEPSPFLIRRTGGSRTPISKPTPSSQQKKRRNTEQHSTNKILKETKRIDFTVFNVKNIAADCIWNGNGNHPNSKKYWENKEGSIIDNNPNQEGQALSNENYIQGSRMQTITSIDINAQSKDNNHSRNNNNNNNNNNHSRNNNKNDNINNRNRNRNKQRRTGLSKQTLDRNVVAYLAQLDIRKQRLQIKKEEQRTSRITSLMLGSVCVCYLPYFGVIMWWITDSNYSNLSHTIGSIAILFVPVKALLNPILNFYTMPSMRRRLKKVLQSSRHSLCCSLWKKVWRGRSRPLKGNSIDWRSTANTEGHSEITNNTNYNTT